MKMMIVLLALVAIGVYSGYVQPPYPAWAHSHWVWLNGKMQNQSNLEEMVARYQSYNITVGALNIDSAWTTGFNNFKWNYTKFPNPKGLIDKMHQEGIRVIAWVTSLVNNDSSNYQEGKQKGYFLNKGGLVKWWHGYGSFLDYRNKQAVEWWHRQMDEVLDIGLDGWKTDGSDPILLLLKPWPYSQKKTHVVTYREYADSYYGDFFNYTRSKNPAGLIMSRPVDNGLQKFYLSYSPKYVMFSGWVGDQNSTYDGLRYAMKNVFQSAWRGYLNFGFDIGGYKGQNISKEGFLRYAQIGSLLPLMENGGNGRHCPWLYDDQTIDIYRKFVNLHMSLLPYFLTAATQALPKGVSVIQPLAHRQRWIALSDPSSFGYLLWDDILIYPIFNDEGYLQIEFPKKSGWVYFFNHEKVFREQGPARLTIDLDQSTVFLREGSTIPLNNHYILVYPSAHNYTRTILNQNYTDQVSYSKQKERFQINIQRYYKNSQVPTNNSITVEIVGAKKYTVPSDHQPRYKDNTLIFKLAANSTLVIPDLVVGSVEDQKGEVSGLLNVEQTRQQ